MAIMKGGESEVRSKFSEVNEIKYGWMSNPTERGREKTKR